MNKIPKSILILILSILMSSVILATAHVPINAEGNNGLSSAQEVTNPTKSWAIYSNLDDSTSVSYFEFDLTEGERMYIQLFVTTRENEASFLPEFAIMGPGLSSNDSVPNYVETTGNVIVVEGERGEPGYEPFGPSHTVEIAKYDQPAPTSGTFYIAVYTETSIGGHFGLAIGIQESFTLVETLLNPVNVIEVYRWQGESWFTILLPFLLTFLIGGYLIHSRFEELSKFQLMISTLGLLFLSSPVAFTYQIFYNAARTGIDASIIVSIIIVLIQSAIASGILIQAKNVDPEENLTLAIKLAGLSVIAGLIWVGVVIGPVIGLSLSLILLGNHINSTL